MRAQRRMNQADLSERSGVKQSILSKIETGARPNPTADIVKKLARALGVTTDYLLGVNEDDDKEQHPTTLAVSDNAA
jgi:transcriptional regulator with XRE-family HTH domain